MSVMSAAQLLGALDDAVCADRPAVAVLLYRAIQARAATAGAAAHERDAAKRSAELLAKIPSREFDDAHSTFKRLDAAVKWMEYWRGAIQGRPNPLLKLQAARRAA